MPVVSHCAVTSRCMYVWLPSCLYVLQRYGRLVTRYFVVGNSPLYMWCRTIECNDPTFSSHVREMAHYFVMNGLMIEQWNHMQSIELNFPLHFWDYFVPCTQQPVDKTVQVVQAIDVYVVPLTQQQSWWRQYEQLFFLLRHSVVVVLFMRCLQDVFYMQLQGLALYSLYFRFMHMQILLW